VSERHQKLVDHITQAAEKCDLDAKLHIVASTVELLQEQIDSLRNDLGELAMFKKQIN